MAVKWNKDLSVGVIWIDNQHKALLKILNNLTDAISRGEVLVELANIVKFLESYVLVHFATEEKYMLKYNYPRYKYHKEEHLRFLKDFNNLKEEFKTTGISTKLAAQIQKRVIEWYLEHIDLVDKDMGKFLRRNVQKKMQE